MKAYESLANAIIIQACEDYKKAYKNYINRYRNSDKPDEELVRLERFFRSTWYKSLTTIDGEYLMEKIRKETSV